MTKYAQVSVGSYRVLVERKQNRLFNLINYKSRLRYPKVAFTHPIIIQKSEKKTIRLTIGSCKMT